VTPERGPIRPHRATLQVTVTTEPADQKSAASPASRSPEVIT